MIGEIIKKIRLDKGISPYNVYNGIMTKSSYWRFENEGAQTSFESVYQFLRRLNISFDEFMNELPGINYLVFDELLQRQEKYFNSKNIEELTKLSNEFKNLYENTKSLRYKHFHATTEILICRIRKEKYKKKDVEPLQDYLMKCEMWTYYEIRLLVTIMFVFDYEVVPILFESAYSRIKDYSHIYHSWNEEIILLINFMSLCIQNKDDNNLRKLMMRMNDEIVLSEKSTYNRILIKWAKAIIFAYFEKDEIYIKQANEAIEVFSYLEMEGAYNLYKTWTNFYSDYFFPGDD
jgi:Rgg/GadR/MutR family transcriptional activator